MEKPIIWTNRALTQLDHIFLNLLEESKSIDVADKVVNSIYESVAILSTHPEIYEVDELRINNDGSIRSYEHKSHQISYQVTEKEIYILRVRAARKEPLKY